MADAFLLLFKTKLQEAKKQQQGGRSRSTTTICDKRPRLFKFEILLCLFTINFHSLINDAAGHVITTTTK
jgi:hypothetical protein